MTDKEVDADPNSLEIPESCGETKTVEALSIDDLENYLLMDWLRWAWDWEDGDDSDLGDSVKRTQGDDEGDNEIAEGGADGERPTE